MNAKIYFYECFPTVSPFSQDETRIPQSGYITLLVCFSSDLSSAFIDLLNLLYPYLI